MVKFLFLDYRDYESVEGFTRRLEQPKKHRGNPVLVSGGPFEGDWMSFYGSVVRRPDDRRWQMWYSVLSPKLGLCLAYAESDDGIGWERPALEVIKIGRRKTNLVFASHVHGPAVMVDERESRPDWRYKMMAGAAPSHKISAFRSADGVHWLPAAENPVIGTSPDCPMSLLRANDGRYVAYHRPGFGDRRVGRTESWDFVNWSEAKLVMEPDPNDPPQTQLYGLGAVPYGAYEVGTLWVYHTVESDMDFYKMRGRQEPELAYCRSGYAWHRAAQGRPFIPLGARGSWEWGSIQPASAPVFLEDEIRFYYVGKRTEHGERDYGGTKPRCGIGFVSLKPDRFISLAANAGGAKLLTRPFWTETPEFYVNAGVRRGGEIRVEITNLDGRPIEGFRLRDCRPIVGDSIYHRIEWKGGRGAPALANRQIRLRVAAKNAKLYSLFSGTEEEAATYWKFRIPYFLDMKKEKLRT